jgi:hypothetical protein
VVATAGEATRWEYLVDVSHADWDFWFDVLSGFPKVRHVAKEFQTGNRRVDVGLPALHELDRLQQRLGRRLHPIAIGGAQYAMFLAQRFDSYTIMDSRPFMTATKRRELVFKDSRLRSRRRRAKMIDDLLEWNESRYAAMLELQRGAGAQRRRRRLPLVRVERTGTLIAQPALHTND